MKTWLSLAASALATGTGIPSVLRADTLPQPCAAGTCGPAGPSVFVSAGRVNSVRSGDSLLTIEQLSDRAILNWESFDIGPGARVDFKQPSATSVALNRIFQSSASQIAGALTANGQVYLINRNGIVFSGTASVDVGSMLASSLDIDEQIFSTVGIARAVSANQPSLRGDAERGAIVVAEGASIGADEGGRVLIFAPEIDNAGNITAPDGQVLLAASEGRVYLAPSSDPALRGLVVEVDVGGLVRNSGTISSPRGNVTLLGAAVNQQGIVSATTTVHANGSIRLLARDGATIQNLGGFAAVASQTGELVLGADSETVVRPELESTLTAVDEQPQAASTIELLGRTIHVGERANLTATGGRVSAAAVQDPAAIGGANVVRNDSRITIEAGANIDVAGDDSVVVAMERNIVEFELRGNELADAPLQREGPLSGETIAVDIRAGTPLTNISAVAATIERSVGERLSLGGDIDLVSEGEILLAPTATLDVSGGSIRYADGMTVSTRLAYDDGRVVDIGSANPDQAYSGLADIYIKTHKRWGVTEAFASSAPGAALTREEGYVEGKDAGSILLRAADVVMNAEILAGTVAGRHQRQGRSEVGANVPAYSRAYDQVPSGGVLSLQLAPSVTVIRDVEIVGGAKPLRAPQELPLDRVLTLAAQDIANSGLQSVSIATHGRFNLASDADFSLQAGGEFNVVADAATLAGRIDIAGGRVAVAARTPTQLTSTLAVLDGAEIDVSGTWVNDNPLLAGVLDPVVLAGGTIKFDSNGDLSVAEGARLIADGGAWLDDGGTVHAGAGGAIELAADAIGGARLSLGGDLRAYALSHGGKLHVESDNVAIAEGDIEADAFTLDAAFFSRGGFAAFIVAANDEQLEIAPGTVIAARQDNFSLLEVADSLPAQRSLTGLTTIARLPDEERRASSLKFSLSQSSRLTPSLGTVRVGQGADLSVDTDGALSFVSDGNIVIDGRLTARSGSINLETTTPAAAVDAVFRPNQGIWLEANARLDASASFIALPNDDGFRVGELRDAGDVDMTARRGFIATHPDSAIDISGRAVTLDLPLDHGAEMEPVLVAARAGSVNLTAADGIVISGRIDARAAAGVSGAAGGALGVTLDAGIRGISTAEELAAGAFGTASRVIALADSTTRRVVGAGQTLPVELRDRAEVSAELIRMAGFDDVSLTSANVLSLSSAEAASISRIEAVTDIDLGISGNWVLDSSVIDAGGHDVSLRAAVVSLGQSNQIAQPDAALVAAPAGRFSIEASLIDLFGSVGIAGARESVLVAAEDIRLRGVRRFANRTLNGRFATGGDLTLDAQRIYPTTLSNFELHAGGDDSQALLTGPGAVPAGVLSAGGRLAVNANRIDVAGAALLAPLGSLELNAATALSVADGSLLSTSLRGAEVPFGRTQGGFDWVFPLGDELTLIVDAPPAQSIDLAGGEINVATGATLDLSGGGEIVAYEFVPGPGGTRDVLSPASNGEYFAVLPALGSSFAPFDPLESRDTDIALGQTIMLAAAPGLPAGEYAVLPARYALLPGAFLIAPSGDVADFPVSESAVTASGGTVVAGRYARAGSEIVDSRWRGFVVEPGQIALTRSELAETRANEFFGAKELLSRLPRDAGELALSAQTALILEGQLNAQPAAGGRGSVADIASNDILITANAAQSPGQLLLDPQALQDLGTASLLIGGRRGIDAETGVVGLEAVAQTVTVDSGVKLDVPELLLIAVDEVELREGASLASSGVGATDVSAYASTGDSGFLRIAAGAHATLTRDGAAGLTGNVSLRPGSLIGVTDGAVTIDGTGAVELGGLLDIPGSALQLGAPGIALGAGSGSGGDNILRVDSTALSALNLSHLGLRSGASLLLDGDVALDVESLAIASPGLLGVGDAGRTARLSARNVAIDNPESAATANAVQEGAIEIVAGEMLFSGGEFAIDGFGQALLQADELRFDGTGRIDVGALDIRAGIASAGDGAVYTVSSGASPLTFFGLDPSAEFDAAAVGLGAALTFEGGALDWDAALLLPAGTLSLTATNGDLNVLSNSRIDLGGVAVTFAGQPAFARGGVLAASAIDGNLTIASGASLDVSAGSLGGSAGSIRLAAPRRRIDFAGSLLGDAATPADSASITVDANRIVGMDRLLSEVAHGGFENRVAIRQRANDLTIQAGSSVAAREISLIADAGAVNIQGRLSSPSDDYGLIEIEARDAVAIGGTAALALPNLCARLVLGVSAPTGTISAPGQALSVEGADVSVRMNEGAGDFIDRLFLTDLAGRPPAHLAVELVRNFDEVDGQISAADLAGYRAYLTDFDATVLPVAAGLESTIGLRPDLMPGIEIRSASDLTLAADWNLLNWRTSAGAPGALTLRAAGDLAINANLSDAVTEGVGIIGLPLTTLSTDDSWSYRLVAGADLTSASSQATILRTGDIRLAAGALVRTGTGTIDLAAGRDILMPGISSAIYTAGRSTGFGTLDPLVSEFFLLNAHYPEAGGDITFDAGRDIVGARYRQLVSEWLFRRGPIAEDPFATIMAVYLNDFQQGVAAFGGGTIAATAGRDVVDFAASVPQTMQHVGEMLTDDVLFTVPDNSFIRRGGGSIDIFAGRDLLGGRYFVDGGMIELGAGNDIGRPAANQLAPVVMLGGGSVEVTSQGDLTLQHVLNPFILPFGLAQSQLQGSVPLYFAYGPDDRVALTAVTGDVAIVNSDIELFAQADLSPRAAQRSAAAIYPGRLNMAALRGDVLLSGDLTLFPVADGGLQVYAWNDITTANVGAVNITQSDGDFTLLPTASAPVGLTSFSTESLARLSSAAHANVPIHFQDMTPSRLIAATGSIFTDVGLTLLSAEPVEIIAGQDIIDFQLQAQNLRHDDRTLVQAGRDLLFRAPRGSLGELSSNARRIEVGGPGRIDVLAGNSISLGTSNGIATVGDQINPALADSGADVTVITSLNQGSDFGAFRKAYVVDIDRHRDALVDYLSTLLPGETITTSAAVERFSLLRAQDQQPFLIDVLFLELQAAGEAGAVGTEGAFDHGFEAIATLFPGDQDIAGGDLSLFFSRIQTLDGGDIDILAPRGAVNAGLAATFAGAKSPSELGIVAQRDGDIRAVVQDDFLVNRSRVFALDGGDILLWSSEGDIDAGRGAKTALSAPPPRVTVDESGNVIVEFPPAIAGSGIRAAVSTAGREPGNVYLFAPAGVVSAGDAGIGSAGNLTIAATEILGADNIDVGGISIGVPVDTQGLAAGLTGVSNVAADAARSAEQSAAETGSAGDNTPLADQALGFLEVFILGFGGDDDEEDRERADRGRANQDGASQDGANQ
jgi:filamentous hemagglutinin family protein